MGIFAFFFLPSMFFRYISGSLAIVTAYLIYHYTRTPMTPPVAYMTRLKPMTPEIKAYIEGNIVDNLKRLKSDYLRDKCEVRHIFDTGKSILSISMKSK